MRHQQRMKGHGFFTETIGPLDELTEDKEFLYARIGDVVLELPLDMRSKLLPLIGTRIGILETNISQNEWLICSIPESKSPALEEVGVVNPTLPNAHKGKASA